MTPPNPYPTLRLLLTKTHLLSSFSIYGLGLTHMSVKSSFFLRLTLLFTVTKYSIILDAVQWKYPPIYEFCYLANYPSVL